MLNGHVLVLNRSWVAIHVTPVKRAICLLYQGTARAVHPEDFSVYDFDDWCSLHTVGSTLRRSIATPHFTIRIPEIIQLRQFNGFVNRQVSFSRRNIFHRDQFRCQYCGRHLPKAALTIDHVLPQSRGGQDTWENLVLACKTCNVKKRNRTPEEANMPLLRRPARPTWLPQFGSRVPHHTLASWRQFLNGTYWDFGIEDQAS